MTSREAIAKLNVLSSYDTAKEKRDEYKECIYTIQKDLEILELLKKLPFEIYQNGGGDDWNWFVDTKQSFKISEEEAIKLKEWLKNE